MPQIRKNDLPRTIKWVSARRDFVVLIQICTPIRVGALRREVSAIKNGEAPTPAYISVLIFKKTLILQTGHTKCVSRLTF